MEGQRVRKHSGRDISARRRQRTPEFAQDSYGTMPSNQNYTDIPIPSAATTAAFDDDDEAYVEIPAASTSYAHVQRRGHVIHSPENDSAQQRRRRSRDERRRSRGERRKSQEYGRRSSGEVAYSLPPQQPSQYEFNLGTAELSHASLLSDTAPNATEEHFRTLLIRNSSPRGATAVSAEPQHPARRKNSLHKHVGGTENLRARSGSHSQSSGAVTFTALRVSQQALQQQTEKAKSEVVKIGSSATTGSAASAAGLAADMEVYRPLTKNKKVRGDKKKGKHAYSAVMPGDLVSYKSDYIKILTGCCCYGNLIAAGGVILMWQYNWEEDWAMGVGITLCVIGGIFDLIGVGCLIF